MVAQFAQQNPRHCSAKCGGTYFSGDSAARKADLAERIVSEVAKSRGHLGAFWGPRLRRGMSGSKVSE